MEWCGTKKVRLQEHDDGVTSLRSFFLDDIEDKLNIRRVLGIYHGIDKLRRGLTEFRVQMQGLVSVSMLRCTCEFIRRKARKRN